MKRLLCVTMMLMLAFSLAACSTDAQEEIEEKSEKAATFTDEESKDVLQLPDEEKEVKVLAVNARQSGGSKILYRVDYWSEDYEEGQDGYMDLTGAIFSEEPKGMYKNNNSSLSFVLYDADGNETYSSPHGFGEVLWGLDSGIYIVQEIRSGLDESATYVGLMHEFGNWLSDSPINLTELTKSNQSVFARSAKDIGEGMLSAYCTLAHGNYLILFNTETKSIIPVEDVWDHYLDFYDGTMIFQHWDGGTSGGHKGEICSIDKTGNITTLPTKGDLLATGKNGFVTNADGISFYNRNGELIWNFDEYTLSKDCEISIYEDMVFAGFTGADGNTYIGCLSQESGTLVYEPIRAQGPIYENVLLNTVGKNCFIDLLTGETIASAEDFELEEIEYSSDGLFIIHHTESNTRTYLFYDSKGNPVQPTLRHD